VFNLYQIPLLVVIASMNFMYNYKSIAPFSIWWILTVFLFGLFLSIYLKSDSSFENVPLGTERPTAFDLERLLRSNETTMVDSVSLVISRFGEDLEWFREPQFAWVYPYTIIYNKGRERDFFYPSKITGYREIQIPNVGCEGHTYLYHIVKNYDNLADLTIFLPGSSENARKWNRAQKLVKLASYKPNRSIYACGIKDQWSTEYNFKLDSYKQEHPKNVNRNGAAYNLVHSPIRPFGAWTKTRLGIDKISECITWNGIFAVTRRDVLKRPKSFYETILADVSDCVTCEAGHYLERVWWTLFAAEDTLHFHDL
jgi:Protein of unknown function (DUF3431)